MTNRIYDYLQPKQGAQLSPAGRVTGSWSTDEFVGSIGGMLGNPDLPLRDLLRTKEYGGRDSFNFTVHTPSSKIRQAYQQLNFSQLYHPHKRRRQTKGGEKRHRRAANAQGGGGLGGIGEGYVVLECVFSPLLLLGIHNSHFPPPSPSTPNRAGSSWTPWRSWAAPGAKSSKEIA